jgi:hypothetical protein
MIKQQFVDKINAHLVKGDKLPAIKLLRDLTQKTTDLRKCLDYVNNAIDGKGNTNGISRQLLGLSKNTKIENLSIGELVYYQLDRFQKNELKRTKYEN